MDQGRARIVIEHPQPEIDNGRYPIKRVVGERVTVTADIFTDGHDRVHAVVLYKGPGDREWNEAVMEPIGNDRWRAEFEALDVGKYLYTVRGWVDHFATWQAELRKRHEAGEELGVHLLTGAQHLQEAAPRCTKDDRHALEGLERILREGEDMDERVGVALSKALADLMARYPDKRFASTYPLELEVVVERPKALFSTWYERFPRSCASKPGKHGSFADCLQILPEIARMGFDVWYLPPIHPIGITNRKG
ncbi:MAG: DUF3416 domain-containing protein, partial [Ignavibacteria bacterium]|nr:DUF3416 domain-containing protein [Ignavibacteria bacterium]